MLIPKKIRRSRIWRDLHSMAAFMALSTLLFFCGSIFRVSMSPTKRLEPESMNSEMTYTSHGEHILGYGENGATSVSLQRHNRALQFVDSKKYGKDVSESNEVVDLQNVQQSSQTPQGSFNDLYFQPTFGLDQLRRQNTEIHLDTLSKANYSLQSNKHTDLNMNSAVPQQELTKISKNPGTDENLGGFSSRNDTRTSGNKNNQLDKVPSLFPEKSKQIRLDLNSSEVQLKRLPKAIIIGAKKAGTRALLEFLRLHPNVEGTGPEPHFFDRNYDKGLKWYRDLMPGTFHRQITIEKTPGYFVTRNAPKRIFEMDPSIKLILVVRDPVTRAISDYCQAVSKHAMRPFEEMALLNERLGLVNTSWGAIKIGVYAKHMEHWLQVFPLDQIHLVDGQKLIEEPAREVAKVETFLGLPKYINDSHFYLRGFKGTFPCLIREGKPHCLDEKTKGRDHPVVKESVLQRLRDFYRPFNAKFYQMVGRNFEWS